MDQQRNNKLCEIDQGGQRLVLFTCPGCGCSHGVHVSGPGPSWDWNGSLTSPTIYPSILINPRDPAIRCHSYVSNGEINFLGDCHHRLANKKALLPDWDSQDSF